MPGKWKVERNVIDNKSMFAVYRLKDTLAVDHSGNREYATGYMDDSAEAHEIAERMNNENTSILDSGICSHREEETIRFTNENAVVLAAIKRLEEGEATPNQVRIEFGLEPIDEDWANVKHSKKQV